MSKRRPWAVPRHLGLTACRTRDYAAGWRNRQDDHPTATKDSAKSVVSTEHGWYQASGLPDTALMTLGLSLPTSGGGLGTERPVLQHLFVDISTCFGQLHLPGYWSFRRQLICN